MTTGELIRILQKIDPDGETVFLWSSGDGTFADVAERDVQAAWFERVDRPWGHEIRRCGKDTPGAFRAVTL